MINKRGINKLALTLIVAAIVIAIASFFYMNQGADPLILRDSSDPGYLSPAPTSNSPEDELSLNIEISNFAFNPQTLTIKRGDTVSWINMGSATHAITSDLGNELSSGNIENNQIYSHTFNSLGTFSYHCSVHPDMKGKIIVQ